MAELAVRNLSVAFGRGSKAINAVDDVSFTVPSGSIVGLVGESGSGKSTIARAVVGLQAVSGGSITIDGRELTDLRRGSRIEHAGLVQMIFQDPFSSLNPRMTVAETLAEILALHSPQSTAARRASVDELLDLVRLRRSAASLLPSRMSGGMRQRVAIARALAARPRLIVADEITSALDASVQASVLNLLGELRRDLGLTMLFITHNLAVVRYIADQTVVLNRGRVVESGPSDALIASPAEPYTRALIAAVPRMENAGRDILLH
jgi:peptide/nickel transport system ATP-binding protein